MNAPFEISEETQLRMAAYNRDVAKLIFDAVARPAPKPLPGLSDEDYDAENEAQTLFYEALGEFVAKIEKAKSRTEIRSEALEEFIDDLKRAAPNPIAWSEDINAKRRGWE